MKNELEQILTDAKDLAVRYKKLTGKPLGITGEIGEVTAANLLNIELSEARQEGYDGIRHGSEKIQVKSRVIEKLTGQRLGRITGDHEWDCVVFVWLDENYTPVAIYEADRTTVLEELQRPGSTARNIRGQLGIRKFISISEKVWPFE